MTSSVPSRQATRRTVTAIATGAAAAILASLSPTAAMAGDAPQDCGTGTALVNGSFERPTFPPTFGIYYTAGESQPAAQDGFGWATTASDNQIELWASKSNPSPFRSGEYGEFGTPADSGDQFAELNANERSTLFQDRPTVPGSTLRWSIAHRGRDGAETMRVVMGAGSAGGPGSNAVAQTPDGATDADITDGIGAWGQYTGTYVVPAGQTTTRFAFESVTPAVGGQGNFIDSVVLDVSAKACNDSALTVAGQPVFVDALANDGGHKLVLGAATAPAHGTVAKIGGQYRYTPDAGFAGVDTFEYDITDGFGMTDTGLVTIVVSGSAGPAPVADPLASVDGETLAQRVSIDNPNSLYVPRLLDPSGVPRKSVVVPGVGTYTLNEGKGSIDFAPEATFIGAAPIRYQLTDADGRTTAALYTPTVTATPRTSTGEADFVQRTALNFATGGTVRFLAPGGSLTQQLVVPGVGRYTASETGEGTFEPAAGFAGAPPAQSFRYTDPSGGHADNTWTPAVTPTSAGSFELSSKRSSGPGGATQIATSGFYPDWSHYTVKLELGASGSDELTVPGVGRFHVEPSSWRLQFTPVAGWYGRMTIPVSVKSSHGFTATTTYQATVRSADYGEEGEPQPRVGVDVTSRGIGTAVQHAAITVPAGGSAQFLATAAVDSPAYSTWTDPGKGVYTIDAATGTVSFAPVLGYVGTPAPVRYQVVDAGRRTTAFYTPTVTRPAAPKPADAQTIGAPADTQSTTLSVPEGGHVTLLGDGDAAVTEVKIAGEGTYTLDPATGKIVFTAVSGFSGRSAGVRFKVTDAYGQTATGLYAATVTALAPAPKPAAPAPAEAPVAPAPVPAGPVVVAVPEAAPTVAACVSKRVFDIHWRVPGKQKIRSITLELSGGKPVTLRGTTRRAQVDLRGRATSRVVLTITAKLAKGGVMRATRDYHPCTAQKPGDLKTLRLNFKPSAK